MLLDKVDRAILIDALAPVQLLGFSIKVNSCVKRDTWRQNYLYAVITCANRIAAWEAARTRGVKNGRFFRSYGIDDCCG